MANHEQTAELARNCKIGWLPGCGQPTPEEFREFLSKNLAPITEDQRALIDEEVKRLKEGIATN